MPFTAPLVNYRDDAAISFTTLTGVQSVSIMRGRQKFYDQFSGSTCVVELIPANSYTTPFALNGIIEIRDANTDTAPVYFSGRVIDIQRQYDIPYNTSTGAAPGDRFILTATGTGIIGTNQITKTFTNTTVLDIAESIGTNLRIQVDSLGSNSSKVAAQTVSGAALDIFNQLLRTGPYMLDDVDNRTSAGFYQDHVLIFPVGYAFDGAKPSFTDTGSGFKFTNIEFLSNIQTNYTQVIVQPEGLANQSTEQATAPYNSLTYDTYNQNTTDAKTLSSYIYSLLSGNANAVPFALTTNTNAAATCLSLATIYSTGFTSRSYIGQEVSLTFRGATIQATVQGLNVNIFPDYASITLYLMPSVGAYLILDNTYNGVLDTNRLGYP